MEQLTNIKTFIQLQVQEKENRSKELEQKYKDSFDKAVSEKVCKGMKIFSVLRHSEHDKTEYYSLNQSIFSLEKVLDYVYDEITKLNDNNNMK